MEKDKMISIDQTESIKNLFIHLTKLKSKMTLWQSIDSVGRIWKTVVFKKFDLKKDELVFLPRKGMFNFNSKLPIYFYSENKTTIFKNSIFYNSKLNLVLKTPEKIMLQNNRFDERECLDKLTSVKLCYDDRTGLQKELWFKSTLIDRSENGFSFKSSINNVISFQEGDRISYMYEGMTHCQKGMISNISTYFSEEVNEKYIRVGVKVLKE